MDQADQANRLREMMRAKLESPASSKSNKLGAREIKNTSRVITVTSGKGGVGKSNFTVNLAISLAKLGRSVVVIDADFGLSNVEVLLGVVPNGNFSEFLFGSKNIEDIITDTSYKIKFISGGSGFIELGKLSEVQLTSIVNSLSYLDNLADYILIDTGAGISDVIINFIKASDETIIITTPEPTSVADAYTLVKSVHEEGFSPDVNVVINRVESDQEGYEIFEKIRMVAKRFLNIELGNYGYIRQCPSLVKAVKLQKPVSTQFPNSNFSRFTLKLAREIMIKEYKEPEHTFVESNEKFLEDTMNRFDDDTIELSKFTSKKQQNVGIVSFVKKLANIFNK